MHYFSVFIKRILCAALLLGLLLSVSCPVFAAEGDIKIDETKSLLEDSDTSGEGYLRVEATTPVGFEGTLCVELRRGFKSVTIQLSPYEYYISGQYLEPGTYTVKKAYALNDDSAIVTADSDEVVVDTDGDVLLQLTVTTDPKADEEWLAMMETYTYPELPSDPVTEATEPPEESTSYEIVTVTTGDAQETAPIEVVSSSGTTALGLLRSMVATAVLGLLFYLLVKKIRELHSNQ